MSKFKSMLKEDITKCEELIKTGVAKRTDVNYFVGKYIIDYPNFSNGLRNHVTVVGNEHNEIENIKIIKGKLEYLLNRGDNPDLFKKQDTKAINVNTSNNINVSSMIEVSLTIGDIEKQIDENTSIGDNEKKELKEKLKEIESLQQSKEPRAKKWTIAKAIIKYVFDKGVDIAIMFIPQILKALQ